MQDLAKQTGMVLVVPMYEEDAHASGVYYNTAAVIDGDGTYLGKYRKTHIPHVKGFWEKYYFRPGNLGYPVFETAVGKVGVYICYDRHFPEGARALGLNGAEMVFIPSATSRGLSEYLWRIEQPSHAVANGYFVGTINRVGIEPLGEDDFYGQSYFCDPRGQVIGGVGSAHDEELLVRDMDLDMITEVRQTWQFYRDRRPDAYDDLVVRSALPSASGARPGCGGQPCRSIPGARACSSGSRSSPTTPSSARSPWPARPRPQGSTMAGCSTRMSCGGSRTRS